MRRWQHVARTFLALCACLLAACGGDSGPPRGKTGPSGALAPIGGMLPIGIYAWADMERAIEGIARAGFNAVHLIPSLVAFWVALMTGSLNPIRKED